MAAHKHAEVIKAWANGAEIEVMICGEWHQASSPQWDEYLAYRIKPAEPERVSLSTMTGKEMREFYVNYGGGVSESLAAMANEVIKRSIEAGLVVTREEFDRMCGDRKARDMAVAEAVAKCFRKYIVDCDYHPSMLNSVDQLNLRAIIAEVKP